MRVHILPPLKRKDKNLNSQFFSYIDFSNLDGLSTYLGNDAGGDLTTDEIEVTATGGRYRAEVKDNTGDRTLFFHGAQGRLDYVSVTGDFEAIAYNAGCGRTTNSQLAPDATGNPTLVSGLHIHHSTLSSINYCQITPGQRNGTNNTIERKRTLAGTSNANDIGADTAANCRADLRCVRDGADLLFYYRAVGDTTWIPLAMPGTQFTLTSSLLVGLVTFAFGTTGVPFVGTCDLLTVQLL